MCAVVVLTCLLCFYLFYGVDCRMLFVIVLSLVGCLAGTRLCYGLQADRGWLFWCIEYCCGEWLCL